MVLQLADALDRTGVAAQPRAGNFSLLVERQAATATGQALPGQVRTRPIQRATETIQAMAEGSRVCDAYLRGFSDAQVILLSDAAREQGAPGRAPLCLREYQ
eukprot:11493184-Alexandrium_andersonii.AAC.1